MKINGFCAPDFEPLYDTFAADFHENGDSGAAFAVRQHGELIVSLWTGSADRGGETPYTYVTTSLGQSLFMDRRSVTLVEQLYRLL